ncbi:hypothetical protein [Flavobacterium ginsenosidimutans]|uniref:hypothetical protein n=1 Tax=Flavobacterium ginsenosidimutans TaxID=687844 RepID=UPI003D968B88
MNDSTKEQNVNNRKVALHLIAKRLFRLVLMCTGIIGVKFIFNSFEPLDRFDFFITITFTVFLWVLLIAENKI